MICEKCETNHSGEYGSGRFCSKECARAYSTMKKRSEINVKIGSSLKGRKLTDDHIAKLKHSWKKRPTKRPTDIKDILIEHGPFSSKYVKERIIAEGIKSYKCETCNISEYMNKPITLQLHHVNGVHDDHRIENLQILCPNCHSQTENYAGRNRSLRGTTE